MAERPVKLLLNSYFEMFQRNLKLETCEKMGVSTKRFPESYTQHGDLASLIRKGELSDKFLQHESMLKIPPKTGEMKVAKNIESGSYLLFLDLVPSDYPWDDSVFAPFADDDKTKDQVAAIKGHVGKLMHMAQFVFACLKKNNDKELNTVFLDAVSDNVTLKIRDSRIPKYDHPYRIGFKIIKNPEDEPPENN